MVMYGRALEHLRVDDVGDDRLVLARQILVQRRGERVPVRRV